MHTHASNKQKNKSSSIAQAVSDTQHGGHLHQGTSAAAQRKAQEIGQSSISPEISHTPTEEMPQDHPLPQPIQQKENHTGIPDTMKAGVENLSGHSMDDVKVHYNSDKPAELNAHAYAQGTDIHLGPGQEKHLPHEAWHVIQQKQGRVKPTMQMKGTIQVNDDDSLEKEADVMGSKILQHKKMDPVDTSTPAAATMKTVQRFKFPWERKRREGETDEQRDARRDTNRLTTAGVAGIGIGTAGIIGGITAGIVGGALTAGIVPAVMGLGALGAGIYATRRGLKKQKAERQRAEGGRGGRQGRSLFHFPWEKKPREGETEEQRNARRDTNRLTTSGVAGIGLGLAGIGGAVATGIIGGALTAGILPVVLGVSALGAGIYATRRGRKKQKEADPEQRGLLPDRARPRRRFKFHFPWERKPREGETDTQRATRRDTNRLTTTGVVGATIGAAGIIGGATTLALGGALTAGILPAALGLGTLGVGLYTARRGYKKKRAEDARFAQPDLEALEAGFLDDEDEGLVQGLPGISEQEEDSLAGGEPVEARVPNRLNLQRPVAPNAQGTLSTEPTETETDTPEIAPAAAAAELLEAVGTEPVGTTETETDTPEIAPAATVAELLEAAGTEPVGTTETEADTPEIAPAAAAAELPEAVGTEPVGTTETETHVPEITPAATVAELPEAVGTEPVGTTETETHAPEAAAEDMQEATGTESTSSTELAAVDTVLNTIPAGSNPLPAVPAPEATTTNSENEAELIPQ